MFRQEPLGIFGAYGNPCESHRDARDVAADALHAASREGSIVGQSVGRSVGRSVGESSCNPP